MKGLQRLISNAYKAICEYGMIKTGDKVAVGVSGGKDSICTLYVLNEIKKYYDIKFDLIAITIDMQFEHISRNKTDFNLLKSFIEQLGIDYYIEKTDIAEIVFNVRKETNPCSLCAKMRRGALCNKAIELGANKIVLGHHFDDVIETFVMNLFFEGRIGCFSPVTMLENSNILLIRPMIYSSESEIKYFINSSNLPITNSDCPEDKMTERENIKILIRDLEKNNKGLKHRIFKAIQKSNIDGFKDSNKKDTERQL